LWSTDDRIASGADPTIVLWSGFAMPVTAMKSTRSSHACSILREE
jgi:hypothetical protein